jgi:DNA invertase Pin-like site-specific DNA recombinase
MIHGYARVSTDGQSIDAQVKQLRADRAPAVLPHHAELARQAIECALDERAYEKGIEITDAEMEALDIRGDTFHPEWNYTVHPHPQL